jgi:hypothetical protein
MEKKKIQVNKAFFLAAATLCIIFWGSHSYGQANWEKTFGGIDDDWVFSVQQTSDGGYIIAGYTESYGAGLADAYLSYYKPETPGVLQAGLYYPHVDTNSP